MLLWWCRYFKRIDVPALRRQDVALDPRLLSFEYGSNTLVLSVRRGICCVPS